MTLNEQPWAEIKDDTDCPDDCGEPKCSHWERNGIAARWTSAQDPTRR